MFLSLGAVCRHDHQSKTQLIATALKEETVSEHNFPERIEPLKSSVNREVKNTSNNCSKRGSLRRKDYKISLFHWLHCFNIMSPV